MIRRLLRDSDVIAGAALAALGVFIITEANKWEYTGFDGPGPGFFPLWYGIAITVLSLGLVLSRLRKAGETGAIDWPGTARALATWAAFAAAVALMQLLGFIVSFGLLTLFMVRVQFGQPWKTALLTAIGLAGGFYLLFPLALDVRVPVGHFGF